MHTNTKPNTVTITILTLLFVQGACLETKYDIQTPAIKALHIDNNPRLSNVKLTSESTNL